MKLFDKHKGFTAQMELQLKEASSGQTVMMPGTLAFSDGTTRFDMDLTKATGDQIPPGMAAQLEQLGMAKVVVISRPKEDSSLLIYPGLKAYMNQPMPNTSENDSADDYEIEVSELAKEEISGHDCVKNKVIITGKDGQRREATVWNASELKDFPVRIETEEQGNRVAMQFKDIQLTPPAADLFKPPSGYKEYADGMSLMQEIMMKGMNSGAGAPPAR